MSTKDRVLRLLAVAVLGAGWGGCGGSSDMGGSDAGRDGAAREDASAADGAPGDAAPGDGAAPDGTSGDEWILPPDGGIPPVAFDAATGSHHDPLVEYETGCAEPLHPPLGEGEPARDFGTPLQVAPEALVGTARWTTDGHERLYRLGTGAGPVLDLGPRLGDGVHPLAPLQKGGRRIAYMTWTQEIHVHDLEARTTRRVSGDARVARFWISSDGEWVILLVAGREGAPVFVSHASRGEPRMLVDDLVDSRVGFLRSGLRVGLRKPRVAGGRLIFHDGFAEAEGVALHSLPLDGSPGSVLNPEGASAEFRGITPDGSRLIFTSDEEGPVKLYAADLDGSERVELSAGTTYVRGGGWILPDGAVLFLGRDEMGSSSLIALEPDGTNRRTLSGEVAVSTRALWTSDGSTIVFAGAVAGEPTTLYRAPADGGEPTPIAEDPSLGRTIMSPDDAGVFTAVSDGLYFVPLDASGPRLLSHVLPEGGEVGEFTVSPEGEHVAYAATPGTEGFAVVYVTTRDDPAPVPLSPDSPYEPREDARAELWLGDVLVFRDERADRSGPVLYAYDAATEALEDLRMRFPETVYADVTGLAASTDGSALGLNADTTPGAHDDAVGRIDLASGTACIPELATGPGLSAEAPTFAGDAAIFPRIDGNAVRWYAIRPAPCDTEPLHPEPTGRVSSSVRVSPDQATLVFQGQLDGEPVQALWAMDTDGGNRRRLSPSGAEVDLGYRFVHGSDRVLFFADPGDGPRLYSAARDGTDLQELGAGLDGGSQCFGAGLTADREQVAFVSASEGSASLYVAPTDGAQPARRIEADGLTPDEDVCDHHWFTADGSFLLMLQPTEPDYYHHLLAVPVAGGSPIRLSAAPGTFRIARSSPDDGAVLFTANRQDGPTGLYRASLPDGQVTALHEGVVVEDLATVVGTSLVVYPARVPGLGTQIFVVDASGTTPPRRLSTLPEGRSVDVDDGSRLWALTPDGEVVFAVRGPHDHQPSSLYRVPVAGGTPTVLNDCIADHPIGDMQLSADGQSLFVVADMRVRGVDEIFRIDL